MITVISATNRSPSNSIVIAKYIFGKLGDQKVNRLLDLCDFPLSAVHAGMYEEEGQDASLRLIQDDFMLNAGKFIFIVPEYNGSAPGILKLFIDACSARAYQETFGGKKAMLIGVSTGRAGNLRGLDHLSAILQYLGVIVYPEKQPVSLAHTLITEDGELHDEELMGILDNLLAKFGTF